VPCNPGIRPWVTDQTPRTKPLPAGVHESVRVSTCLVGRIGLVPVFEKKNFRRPTAAKGRGSYAYREFCPAGGGLTSYPTPDRVDRLASSVWPTTEMSHFMPCHVVLQTGRAASAAGARALTLSGLNSIDARRCLTRDRRDGRARHLPILTGREAHPSPSDRIDGLFVLTDHCRPPTTIV